MTLRRLSHLRLSSLLTNALAHPYLSPLVSFFFFHLYICMFLEFGCDLERSLNCFKDYPSDYVFP